MPNGTLDRRRSALHDLQREHIVEGFAAAALDRSYAQATISDIVRVAQVSKSTFYEHFVDKEAVYLHLHGAVQAAVTRALRGSIEHTARESEWRVRAGHAVGAYLGCMASKPTHLAQVRIEPQVASAASRTARAEAGQQFGELIQTLAQRLISRPDIDILPDALVRAGLAGTLALVAAAAEAGPEEVQALEPVVTELWIRLTRA